MWSTFLLFFAGFGLEMYENANELQQHLEAIWTGSEGENRDEARKEESERCLCNKQEEKKLGDI